MSCVTRVPKAAKLLIAASSARRKCMIRRFCAAHEFRVWLTFLHGCQPLQLPDDFGDRKGMAGLEKARGCYGCYPRGVKKQKTKPTKEEKPPRGKKNQDNDFVLPGTAFPRRKISVIHAPVAHQSASVRDHRYGQLT